ncbi:MAG: peptidoglycan DD-metalloendopeptidase family protein [Pseudomonadota bacterium]
MIAKFNTDPTEDRFSNETVLMEIPEADDAQIEAIQQLGGTAAAPESIIPAEAEAVAPRPEDSWRTVSTEVKPGDSLAVIFKRHGLPPREVYLISQSEQFGPRLKSIFPGHEMQLKINESNQLMALTYSTGPLDTLEYLRQGDAFVSQQITAEPDRVTAYKHGTIDHSLFVASQRAGLSDSLTMRLAQIFQWDVDFVLDIRPGDSFYVVFEDLYLDNEFIGHGDILAAEFINQGEAYRAVQYINDDGTADYYAPDGQSMRKAFLRAPVEFSRISSNFNLRRVHPLWKTVRPHRGIDYAAPAGTPILAAGDGKVTQASRTQANGNFVVIQHGEQFVTKYLHLSKFGRGIKRGAKVSQGQVIGLVGATGWATAPHLHYEFLVNGVHKNPRTVSLPDAQPVAQNEMQRFRAHAVEYSNLLDNYKNQISVALAR